MIVMFKTLGWKEMKYEFKLRCEVFIFTKVQRYNKKNVLRKYSSSENDEILDTGESGKYNLENPLSFNNCFVYWKGKVLYFIPK